MTLLQRLIIIVVVTLLVAIVGANYRAYKERPVEHRLVLPLDKGR